MSDQPGKPVTAENVCGWISVSKEQEIHVKWICVLFIFFICLFVWLLQTGNTADDRMM